MFQFSFELFISILVPTPMQYKMKL